MALGVGLLFLLGLFAAVGPAVAAAYLTVVLNRRR